MSERPSKSARKREAQSIRALADRLVELTPEALVRIVDDADVIEAVRAAQDMPSHGAGRRQRQYIAKLLRAIDTGTIMAALAQADAGPAEARRRFHQAERLRDALLDGRDAETTLEGAGLEPSPDLDEALAAWRDAHGDAARKRASRTVFRVLHAALEAREHTAGSG